MIYICTVSDKSYLRQGLALYDSLLETTSEFKLFYLCIDNESHALLSNLNLPNIEVFSINYFLSSDKKLNDLRHGRYRSGVYNYYSEFCWCLASYFSNFILKNLDHIFYVDSDIIFYKDINLIKSEIKDKDVGIFRHRQFELDESRAEGLFNVGVVYFKNSKHGLELSTWWKDAVLNKNYPQYNTCGDQKYLEAFVKVFDQDKVFIDGNIGHCAPWHLTLFNFDYFPNNGKIVWQDKLQDLVFNHFSQFKYNLSNNTFIHASVHKSWTRNDEAFKDPIIHQMYVNYFEKIKLVEKKWIKGKI